MQIKLFGDSSDLILNYYPPNIKFPVKVIGAYLPYRNRIGANACGSNSVYINGGRGIRNVIISVKLQTLSFVTAVSAPGVPFKELSESFNLSMAMLNL